MSASGKTELRDQVATVEGSGTATAPAANATIVLINIPAAGLWEITAVGLYGATGDAAGNMKLFVAGVGLMALPVQGGNNGSGVPITVVRACAAGDAVTIAASAAGVAGSIYWAFLVARRVG